MDKNIANNEFYISKNITMKLWHIKYNYYVDFLSNCILPIIIPILNILLSQILIHQLMLIKFSCSIFHHTNR